MANWHTEDTDNLCKAILKLKNVEEAYAFLDDICTIKEMQDISQRLKVAQLLEEETAYMQISKITGASTATISRVSKCLEYGTGGYKLVLDRMKKK